MNNLSLAETLLRLTGIAQVVMMLAVLPLPRWLNWKAETAKLGVITRQVFWIYAAYILSTNIFLGGITYAFADQLLVPTGLANTLLGFMLVYWGARLALQLFVIDKTAAPKGWIFAIGERLLTLLFIFFTASYAFALFRNLNP